MNLSSFDLNWYRQWASRHTSMEEYSRPGLTNFLGSIQSGGDVSSIRHPMFPPVSACEESTAYLTVNGTFLPATRIETEHRWTPWNFERTCTVDDIRITTHTCMPMGVPGVAMTLRFENVSDAPKDLNIGLRLSGRCLNKGVEPWYWGVPQVGLSVTDLHDQGGMNPVVERTRHTHISAERTEGDSRAWCGQSLYPAPDKWGNNGDAVWSKSLAPGGSLTIQYGLSMGEDRSDALKSEELARSADQLLKQTETAWRELWQDVFTGGPHLSGSLQDLDLPEELLPVAASSVLSALLLRRTHKPNQGKVRYSISMPRRVEACFYPNDWAMAGRLLVEMDPDPTWQQLEMALCADIRSYNQINTLTGKGGDFTNQEGWPYTIDIYNLFFVAWNFVESKGEQILHQTILTERGPESLLQAMENLAFDWRNRRVEEWGLADYGPRQELLECVTTYEHVVAGLNACAAWMLFRLANIYRSLDRIPEAESAEAEAQGIIDAILSHLYIGGSGWFRAIQPDGSTREVRHCWDISMVLVCIGDRLPEQVQEEIVTAFQNELQTPAWMCALSPHDADAAVSGTRADHQYNGAFGSWPAFMSLGLQKIGRTDLVTDWLHGIARTARQGPFAQAYYTENVMNPLHGGAVKVTDELPHCCHWCNLSGGTFYQVLQTLSA